MPELPDVEQMRSNMKKVGGKKIESVHVNKNRMFKVSDSTIRRHLVGNRITKVIRHGKYLFAQISDGTLLVLHFGMTGDIVYGKNRYDHRILGLEYSNGKNLNIVSVRKLGIVDVTDDIDNYISKKGIGPDALRISKEEFRRTIGSSSGFIKNVLMDQKKMAGIGNIYADEILYQSNIHPKRRINKLKDSEIDDMYQTMLRILKLAIRHNADPDNYPQTYLISNRKEGACCKKGHIKKIRVNGRPTYYCPDIQK